MRLEVAVNHVVVVLIVFVFGLAVGAAVFAIATRDTPELRQPTPRQLEQPSTPAEAGLPESPPPAPEAADVPLGIAPREGLRKILGREPRPDELATLEEWLQREE
jgi:hypothetical protein